MIKTLEELENIIDAIEVLYRDEYLEPYGYTRYLPDGRKEYLVFRDRSESFREENAIAILPYDY